MSKATNLMGVGIAAAAAREIAKSAAGSGESGMVVMQTAIPDSEEATSPTTAEFNAVLAALRAAGVIATA